jgi:hypothetical protein
MLLLEEAKAEVEDKYKEGEIPPDMEEDALMDKHPKSSMAAEKTVMISSSLSKGINSSIPITPS